MTITRQHPTVIKRVSIPKVTIWQDYFAICVHARTPYCAAAILDFLDQHPPSTSDGWIIMSSEDIHDELFRSFWLKTIKHHLQWLADIGYIDCLHDPDDDYGLQAYRLNIKIIQQAIASVSNNPR